MKKIVLLLIFCCSLFLLSGCVTEKPEEKNEFTSEKLSLVLTRLKQKVDTLDNSENEELEIKQDFEDLKKQIISMSIIEFEKFCEEYKSINFRTYSFVLYEKTISIVVKYANDLLKIEDVKIFELFNAELTKIEQLNVGMDVFQVIEKMGYPYVVLLSSINALDYKLENGKIIRIIFDEKMKVLEIKDIDYEAISNPTYTTDDRCDPSGEKIELSKATLIVEKMLFEEVVELIGKPHRTFGSGAIWYEWTLEDGKLLQIMFNPYYSNGNKSLEVVKIIYK